MVFKEFLIASGYKSKIIENYFSRPIKNWKVRIINTGNKTMTGGRIKRLKKFLYKDTFLLTYGDGLSNVDIKKLYNFHIKQKKMITLTAVRPPARFGAIKLIGNKVKYFREKSSIDEGWINGGFFVIEPGIFKYLKNDNTFFEKDPLEKAAKNNQLIAYKHKGFWQCMDTKRDKEILENKLRKKKVLKEKVLVVGGTGFIGRNLIKKLKQKNYSILSISLSVPSKSNKINNVKYYVCDISNKKELLNFLKKRK